MSANAAEQLFTEFRRWRNVVGWCSAVWAPEVEL